jgi:predicted membrane channel-forming protein YqfA (hemolysin III family)
MTFDYTKNERIIMAIITGMSNITSIPVTILVYRKKNLFTFWIALFSYFTSIFYHVCESLDVIFFLPQLKWHELDNIGAICSLNSLILVLTSYFPDLNLQDKLNYFSIFIALICQQKGPWEIQNTLYPIFLFLFIALYDIIKRGLPKFNRDALFFGGSVLMVAIATFVKGLDDGNDYLRIYHSLWHVSIGVSSFYLYQLQEDNIIHYINVMGDFFIYAFNIVFKFKY